MSESEAEKMLRRQREWDAAVARGEHPAEGVAASKSGLKWWQIVLIIFGGLVVLGTLVPDDGKKKDAASNNPVMADEDKAQPASAEVTGTPSAPVSNWHYNSNKDEMRGTETRWASVESENSIDLDFPYGEQSGEITVRHDPSNGLDVFFSVASGQILCNSFTDTNISVKFDDEPIRSYRCTDAADGSSNYAFISSPQGFLAKLKAAKRTVIEADFYRNGSKQFVFQTNGLNWK